VNGEHGDLVACNLCGADDCRVVFEAGEAQVSRIVRCNRCGLMYANPRALVPDYEVLQSSRLSEDSWLSRNRFRLPKELRQVRDYRDTRAYLRRAFPGRGKMVEVGCGTGSLLNTFKEDGWQVEGIDPWGEACDYARERYGITAHATTLEDAKLEEASIDVVLMIHVIEHMLNPAASLAEVYRILKPGGIAVVETPRYDSLMFKLLGKRERSVSCNGHIYFFTTSTLRRLGEGAGLRVDRTSYVGRSLSVDRLVWNVGVMSKSAGIQRILGDMAARLGLGRLWLYLNVRDMQRVYFRKP